ncbi:bifunctional 4-hydroxy-2-oxoglutarate aldolase/2-dehydro-3-deoxy-phosphogluconate aldolase [Halobacillus litoralis]|uniref:bifunctional 4-hydroxy-2-oxoglutarate aldolase/2-dehydro-3-deoxy-phosphogluconate aldolase n=1 Tax=Halobacillus litoralis TaxID=45668 RepID=UPI001CFCC3A9|nr:bifunctional 4-hydroxy-2-oxoglutarate aldolase/2-dehydro-3-deoxy-phosphogluconate aldolase [Halobacillus litoralis]WLR48076.1 bifunctional 4-hydroxy-2-oxoglutarate aldolase/2-dehydro-3-deoxy-phosphogluconate aldolase [Halobacillus litoralis]
MSPSILEQLEEDKIIAIIRGIPAGTGEKVAKALYDGGIRFLEVTLDTEGALEMIRSLRGIYDENLKIGAGTVLNVKDAETALEAGAEYIVSPHFDEEIVTYCLSKGVTVLPGTMTPTEMVRATNLGAPAVKVFPAGALGVKYIKDVRGPLGHISMIATGGVNLENIEEVLQYGVKAVGLGGNLVDKASVSEGKYEEITKRAKSYVSKIEGGVVHG